MRFDFETYNELFPKKEHVEKFYTFEKEKEEESMLNEVEDEVPEKEKEVVPDGDGASSKLDTE